MPVCEKCGAELAPGQRFCQKCGTRVEASPVLEMPQTPAPPQTAPELEIQPRFEEPAAPAGETAAGASANAAPRATSPVPPVAEAPVPPVRETWEDEPARDKKRKDPPPPDPDEPQGKYAPITTKGYIGILLLMSVPVVGWLVMAVWALGGCKKIAKRNLARAWAVILVVFMLVCAILGFTGKIYLDRYLKVNGYPSVSEMFGQGFHHGGSTDA